MSHATFTKKLNELSHLLSIIEFLYGKIQEGSSKGEVINWLLQKEQEAITVKASLLQDMATEGLERYIAEEQLKQRHPDSITLPLILANKRLLS